MNAIILFSYASIHSLDDVESFYHHLFHGNVKEESKNRGLTMYKSLVTCDQLGSNTKRIGEALTRRLQTSTGEEWNFYIGNKHISPFVDDAVNQSIKDGAKRIVTLALTPFYSRTGTEMYEKQVLKSLDEQGYPDIPVTHIPPFYNNDAVVNVLSKRLNDAIHWLPENVRDKADVIFTAHSMPGKPGAHKTFIDQYTQMARRLMNTAKMSNYHIAYRSGGNHPQQWLGPDFSDVMKDIADKDSEAVIVCELLSMLANAEAIQELGEEGKSLANQLGLKFVQTEYPNDSDDFVTALHQHILQEV